MNTDAHEKSLAQSAMMTPQQRLEAQRHAETHNEKQLYCAYPSGNRHERRKAKKLNRLNK